MRYLPLLSCAFLFSSTLHAAPADDFAAGGNALLTNKEKLSDTDRLHRLFDLSWEYSMKESPEFATGVGYPGQNDRWSDLSLEAIERRKKELQAPMKVMRSIDRAKLGAIDQLNYDLFLKNQQDAIDGTRFKGEFMPINQMSGVQQEVARVLDLSPRSGLKDYEDLLARLN